MSCDGINFDWVNDEIRAHVIGYRSISLPRQAYRVWKYMVLHDIWSALDRAIGIQQI